MGGEEASQEGEAAAGTLRGHVLFETTDLSVWPEHRMLM